MTSSVHLPLWWGRLLMQGMLCLASLIAFPLPYQRLRTVMKKCNGVYFCCGPGSFCGKMK